MKKEKTKTDLFIDKITKRAEPDYAKNCYTQLIDHGDIRRYMHTVPDNDIIDIADHLSELDVFNSLLKNKFIANMIKACLMEDAKCIVDKAIEISNQIKFDRKEEERRRSKQQKELQTAKILKQRQINDANKKDKLINSLTFRQKQALNKFFGVKLDKGIKS